MKRKQQPKAPQNEQQQKNQEESKPSQICNCLTQQKPSIAQFQQQILEFATCLLSPNRTIIVPTFSNDSKIEDIEILNILNNEVAIKHRIIRKRQNKKNQGRQTKSGTRGRNREQNMIQDHNFVLMFVCKPQLSFNSIILAMALSQDAIDIRLGLKRQILDRGTKKLSQMNNQNQPTSQFPYILNLYPTTIAFLQDQRKKLHQTASSRRTNNRTSAFSQLKRLQIRINNEATSKYQWISNLLILSNILHVIKAESFHCLEVLEIVVNDQQNYRAMGMKEGVKGKERQGQGQGQEAGEKQGQSEEQVEQKRDQSKKVVQKLYADIGASLIHIFKSKNIYGHGSYNQKPIKQEDDADYGYFPKLKNIKVNPMMFFPMAQKQLFSTNLKQNQNQQNGEFIRSNTEWDNKQSPENPFESKNRLAQLIPIRSLTLVNMSPPLTTDPTQLKLFISFFFPYFPKIARLIMNSLPESDFMLFNTLTAYLHHHCPLLETLHIFKTAERIPNDQGLKNILQKFPYLSDLKIKIWPSRGQEGVEKQFVLEWEYIKEIQIRRVHVQRVFNLIKILESKGYDKQMCTQIIDHIKPIKIPLKIPQNMNGSNRGN